MKTNIIYNNDCVKGIPLPESKEINSLAWWLSEHENVFDGKE